ncbi:MAG TPA: hypothetical protein VGK74_19685 [Symbiobacteriaceae bacterium]|jgi:hypothetical protein
MRTAKASTAQTMELSYDTVNGRARVYDRVLDKTYAYSEVFWLKVAGSIVTSAASLGIREKKGDQKKSGQVVRCVPYGTGDQVLNWADYGDQDVDNGIW